MKTLIPLTFLILLSAAPSYADVSMFYENVIIVGRNIENISDNAKREIQLKHEIYGERNINGVELTALCILGECPNYDVKCIGETHDKCAAYVQNFLISAQESSSTSTASSSQDADQEEVQDAPIVQDPVAQNSSLETSDVTACDPNKRWNHIANPVVDHRSYENEIRRYSGGIYQPETRSQDKYSKGLQEFKTICEDNGGTYTIREETFTDLKNVCGTYNKYDIVYCRFPECDKTRGLVRCLNIFESTIGREHYGVDDDGTCGSYSNIGCEYYAD